MARELAGRTILNETNERFELGGPVKSERAGDGTLFTGRRGNGPLMET